MTVTYTQQMFSATDINNMPLSYGKLYLYKSGTNIPVDTYGSSGNSFVINPWPYILNVLGQADNLYLSSDVTNPLTINLTDQNDVQQPHYPISGCQNIITQIYSNSEVSTIFPTVTLQYDTQTPTNGTNFHIQAITTGDNLRYQWVKNDAPITQWDSLLEFVPITTADSGNYGVYVYNSLGEVYSGAITITVV